LAAAADVDAMTATLNSAVDDATDTPIEQSRDDTESTN
jgi:hypothetical protein